MKTPKVCLYIRIRRIDGADAFVDPAWNRNRTLREGSPSSTVNPNSIQRVSTICATSATVLLLLFLATGLRVSEMAQLDRSTIVIEQHPRKNPGKFIVLGVGEIVGKGNKRRTFYVNKRLCSRTSAISRGARTNIRPSCLPSENSACQQVQCKSAWRISVVWQAWITSTFIGCGIPSPLRWPMRRGTSCSSRNYSGTLR